MRRSLSIATAALLLSSTALARSDNCQIHSKTYGKYDLRGLRKSSGDYEVENTNGDVYQLNFCGPINTQAWAVDHPELVGSYQQGSSGGISLGNVDTDPDMERGVLSFSYTGGSACPKSSARRATVVQLQCDNSWSSGKLQLVKVIDECTYL
ncbi:mannose-6-phosphate receptor binding domain-containing protein [Leucosporidium creatinivorum]|uniref:Mannose-6-phosphate receptor binding domain-containing protein n=1 Tax=Leucosporidium creatinivorum TaxID=106004 RepID=A0A1Y2ELF9_9BASI|nr:mannose-6-phosphate receptor binding domain-containing protein [Leucosporidium creatinivorum]